jgi:glycosyltransferase involved in cell wall biosynthesis
MKVGLSTGMIQGGRSGVAQYVFALLKALLAREDCPELIVFALDSETSLFEFAKAHIRMMPVSDRFRPAVANVFWHQVSLPRLVRQLGVNVLHVPSYRRLTWRKPCPLVATVHDLAAFHVRGKYDPARMVYGRVFARLLARRQDRIIAVSSHTALDLQRFFGIRPEKVTVIPNGLDRSRFQPGDGRVARQQVAARWGLDRPFLLYVSRLEHPAKNHVRLIESFLQFKRSANSKWLLALAGSVWHGAASIYAAARNSPEHANIRFLGFVSDADLPSLYRAADALVYPSLIEGFGFPPLEAMACGCPVLSSRRGGLAEVVGDAAGLLDPEDVRQMAAALAHVTSDPAWRSALCKAGLANAQRFDWSRNAERVLRCYRSAAGIAEPHPELVDQPPMQLIVR